MMTHHNNTLNSTIRKDHKKEDDEEDIPIACVFDRTRNVFRVTRNKGKSLANGGFGIVLPEIDNESEQQQQQQQRTMVDHLFIEEVYFLVERGLLEAYDDDNQRLDSQGIFQLLDVCGITLPVLLVYIHVRAQNYRVIRHTPYRREILKQMEPLQHFYKRKRKLETPSVSSPATTTNPPPPTTTITSKQESTDGQSSISSLSYHYDSMEYTAARKQLETLRQRLREDAAQAPVPVLSHYQDSTTTTTTTTTTTSIAYELYLPDSQFRRSAPGLPNIYIAATTSLHFGVLQTLLQQADGIPLRVAVVSEAGTVVMLGVSDYGVPSICPNR